MSEYKESVYVPDPRFFEEALTKLELSAATHDNQERKHLHGEITKIYLEVWNAYRYPKP